MAGVNQTNDCRYYASPMSLYQAVRSRVFYRFMFLYKVFSYQLWQEGGDNEHNKANDKHGDGLL